MGRPREPLDTSKLIIRIIFASFWVCGLHGNILRHIVSNSHFGKRAVARDMTISELHVDSHVSENVCLYELSL